MLLYYCWIRFEIVLRCCFTLMQQHILLKKISFWTFPPACYAVLPPFADTHIPCLVKIWKHVKRKDTSLTALPSNICIGSLFWCCQRFSNRNRDVLSNCCTDRSSDFHQTKMCYDGKTMVDRQIYFLKYSKQCSVGYNAHHAPCASNQTDANGRRSCTHTHEHLATGGRGTLSM